MVFYKEMMLLAQQGVIVETERDLEAIQDSSFIFNGPQFFAALIAGVVLAFALQLLFTNLAVAAGISMAGGGSSSSNTSSNTHDDNSGGLGNTIKKIGFAVGLGTLISVSLALFIASFLAVKLGLFVDPLSGAIVGLVIWGTFFALMMFFSSQTIGSLLGSVANTATSGMQSILGTATAAIGAGAASRQVVNTAEAAAAAVRKELGMAVDPSSMRENVEDFLESIRPAGIDINKIAKDFEDLLDDENLQQIANSDSLRNIDRNTFIQLISDRSDISKKDADRIADKLESVWRKTTSKLTPASNPITDFTNYIKTATREQLTGIDFGDKIDSLIAQIGGSRSDEQSNNPMMDAATSFAASSLANIVMGRTDLSDFDVDKIVGQLQKLQGQLGEQTDKVASQVGLKEADETTVKKDIRYYLNNAYPWQLKQQNLDREFRNLIYDPAADPLAVANELRQINRSYFVDILKQKGMLSQTQIRSIANILEAIRLEVIATAEAAHAREKSIELMVQVEEYLTTTPKENFSPEKIQIEFKSILEDFDATYEELSTRLAVLDRPTLERMLELRGDMEGIEASAIVGELELARDRALEDSQKNLGQVQAVADRQWLQVQSYLRDTGKGELNPEGIKRELQLLLRNPQAGSSALRARLANFDRDTLVQLLSQRQDLDEEQIEEAIDSVEGTWMRVVTAPREIAGKAQEQYDQATNAIADYLRKTGKPELNPKGIERDLTLLFNNPKLGSKAIRQRIAAMDRDTLVQLLTQRKDLSEDDVNNVINDVQSTLRKIAKAPRRAAIRTQQTIQDFPSAIADYLRSTDKAELSPAGIKRDVELLLNDPRAGAESLKERLAHFDRSTLVALLTQRGDISEEDVNGVVDQILSVRDSVMSQLQKVQDAVQSVIDRILARVKAYLNSLDRPELAYEGIKRDVTVLFDDPQAGFDALKDRFSSVDRNTLIAVMSSREDISKADANRIISQIERTRDRALQRAERIQTETAMRLEAAKRQAVKQVEETRKAAAAACWWLFATALVSGICAAVAGALGVVGD